MNIAVFHELPFGGARDGVYHFSRDLIKNGSIIEAKNYDNKILFSLKFFPSNIKFLNSFLGFCFIKH